MYRISVHWTARVLLVRSAWLLIALGACDRDNATPVGPAAPDTVVASIWVTPSARTAGVLGTRFGVGAAALTEDGSILYGSTMSPEHFTWSSSAPEIAKLGARFHAPTGNYLPVVTGEGEGTATITATSQGLTGSMTVTVRDRARLAWSVPLGPGSIEAGIAIGAEGTIYVGTNEHGADRSRWFAVSPQGSVLWTLQLSRTGHSTPAVGDDGMLYFGSLNGSNDFAGSLIAVDPGGTVRWVLEVDDPIRSSPALGPDGTIYIAGGQHVYAVDQQGKIQWSYEAADRAFFRSSPAVARDGTIYVGGADDLLYAISPDGSLRWTFDSGDIIHSSPSIGVDGTVYFGAIGSTDGRLYAVDPDGTERWSLELGARLVSSSPSIGPDGTIYVIAHGVTAVDPGGSVRWSYGCGTNAVTPILGADGTVYVTGCAQGQDGHAVYALDAQGRLQWDYLTGGHTMGSPAIGSNGMIIAASFSDSYEGTMHAIVETSSTNGGYVGSPWPTARGNRANVGRAGG